MSTIEGSTTELTRQFQQDCLTEASAAIERAFRGLPPLLKDARALGELQSLVKDPKSGFGSAMAGYFKAHGVDPVGSRNRFEAETNPKTYLKLARGRQAEIFLVLQGITDRLTTAEQPATTSP